MDVLSLVKAYGPEELASRIDQTLLVSTYEQAKAFAERSSKYPFRSLVGFPRAVRAFKEVWKGRTCAVVNFPFGESPLKAVEAELEEAWDAGAEEVDVVASPYLAKDDINKYGEYVREILGAARAVGFDVVKVIVEAPVLSDEELARVAKVIYDLGADFLKTATGTLHKTSLRDVYVVKRAAPGLEVKASGGIREPVQALSFIETGASVIGTSTGIEIVEELKRIKEVG
ncbi:deoxyribose-phosphate aldolase [Ignicoccus hospitalis]|uniref:deoxyribose-phosphate aldolase n=1 Tax=Ignicoccus hospitalis TaxID=160233 RepID=UPI0006976D7C|nr:deoxyribose-phosphate aldolase [Ignicoccus hospitalis]HIH90825.1 deoxyribose-phosphate aldolase [Desulfurococcaceae archaeon]